MGHDGGGGANYGDLCDGWVCCEGVSWLWWCRWWVGLMGMVLVVSCDTRRWLIVVWVGKFWLILWVLWFVVMFGDVVVVVRWV